jgi:hypothetical protein
VDPVDDHAVDDHEETGAEIFESCGWAAKSIRLQLFYVPFPLPIILDLFVSIQARLRYQKHFSGSDEVSRQESWSGVHLVKTN